jgi:transposase
MEQYVGLDVSLEFTSICVIDAVGAVVWRGTVVSTPEVIAAAVCARAPHAVRIGLETGQLCTWHWHRLRELGLPVVCIDARHAQAALSLQVNKTDSNDAHGLAQLVRVGWYKEVAVKSLGSHRLRTLLTSRAQLVNMRRDLATKIRGLLKTFGLVVGKVGERAYAYRVRELVAGEPGLEPAVRALLAVRDLIDRQIAALETRILAFAKSSDACRRLMTIPGVGALTAVAFVATVDRPQRFVRSSGVGAYLGLTPRRYQSGEVDHAGRISKCGDGLTRTYLFEAAGTLLTRVSTWSTLKAWGTRLAKRVGINKARVAVARKLAVIMHRIWLDGTSFHWSGRQVAAAVA